jgi:hypothetical protein
LGFKAEMSSSGGHFVIFVHLGCQAPHCEVHHSEVPGSEVPPNEIPLSGRGDPLVMRIGRSLEYRIVASTGRKATIV